MVTRSARSDSLVAQNPGCSEPHGREPFHSDHRCRQLGVTMDRALYPHCLTDEPIERYLSRRLEIDEDPSIRRDEYVMRGFWMWLHGTLYDAHDIESLRVGWRNCRLRRGCWRVLRDCGRNKDRPSLWSTAKLGRGELYGACAGSHHAGCASWGRLRGRGGRWQW
jgi:hypothetical protein